MGTRSTDSTSPVTTVTFAGLLASRSAARSRSTSIPSSRWHCSASGFVMAPRPGPISTTASSGVMPAAATSLLTQAASRKCCAKRLRAFIWFGVAAPVALLDLHDLFLAHPEVMTELVNQRLADGDDDLILVALAVVFDRPLEQGDAIRQLIAVLRALGERRALIQAEQDVFVRVHLELVEQLLRRLILDHDGEVFHLASKPCGNRVDGLLDQLTKVFGRHRR